MQNIFFNQLFYINRVKLRQEIKYEVSVNSLSESYYLKKCHYLFLILN